MAAAASSSSLGGAEEFKGVIEAKFESGYVITLTMGSEELRGVLYEPAKNPIENNGHKRKKKSETKKRDPSLPKLNRSAYNFFFAEKHSHVKTQNQDKPYREISKLVAELWNNLQEPDKMVYKEKAMKDKERYKAEMEAHRESEKEQMAQMIIHAVPLRQVPPQPPSDMFNSDVAMTEADEPDFLQTTQENNYGGNYHQQQGGN